jgi:translation initiation factor IF-3
LIGVDGEQEGVVTIADALERAASAGYDLAEIAPNASPPVVKILDWGKYRYEQTKQEQRNRKNQRQTEVKQIRLGLKIGQHDLDVKAKRAREFLEEGHKVQVKLRFRGREVTHPDLGRAVLGRFHDIVADIANKEQEPQLSGREMTMMLAMKKEAKADA